MKHPEGSTMLSLEPGALIAVLCSILVWVCHAQSVSRRGWWHRGHLKKQVDRILATRDKDESASPFLLKALGEVTFGTGNRPVVGDLGSCSEHSCF